MAIALALSTLTLSSNTQASSSLIASREGAREIWIPRSDIPGLTVAIWDRGSPEVPKASIVVAPQVDQDAKVMSFNHSSTRSTSWFATSKEPPA